MGKDAQLRHASQDDLAQAVAESEIDSTVGAAIIAKSTSELYALLQQGPMFCIQSTPGKEDEEEEEEGDEEEPENSQPKQTSRKASPFAHPVTESA
jgi:CO dehydrogenase/acetyl-CoA synthase beta subunit